MLKIKFRVPFDEKDFIVGRRSCKIFEIFLEDFSLVIFKKLWNVNDFELWRVWRYFVILEYLLKKKKEKVIFFLWIFFFKMKIFLLRKTFLDLEEKDKFMLLLWKYQNWKERIFLMIFGWYLSSENSMFPWGEIQN